MFDIREGRGIRVEETLGLVKPVSKPTHAQAPGATGSVVRLGRVLKLWCPLQRLRQVDKG